MWTGQRYDPGVELYAFVYRTYSPQLGRWLQRDPLGYVDGMNLYEYVRGGPLTWIDPLGLCTWAEWFAGICDEADEAREEARRRAERLREQGDCERAEQAAADADANFTDEAAEEALDGVQNTLDAAGYAPVVGAAADVVNAGISVTRGNYVEAGTSVAGAVPFAGDAFKASADAAKFAAKHGDEAADAASRAFRSNTSPAVPGSPYSPREVSKRQSQTRRDLGVDADPNSPIPDQSPGRNLKSEHKGNQKPGHPERNVNPNEEHSRVPKNTGGGQQSH